LKKEWPDLSGHSFFIFLLSFLDFYVISFWHTASMAKRGPKPRRTEIIWTSEFAYGIGLMASDGCMSSNGRNFEFVSKDIEQVENLRKCFGITTKISRKRSGRK
jgi:hypothetical protein